MQNRELSWLRFNERVLEESTKEENPLFERLFFLSVFTSNLDEFFMVRVGGFQDLVFTNADYTDNKTGLHADGVLTGVYEAVAALYPIRDRAYRALESELAREGMARLRPWELGKSDAAQLAEYFENQIEPLLAPQVIDKTHPFPHIENKRLIVALSMEAKAGKTFGMIPAPHGIERLYRNSDGGYVLLEDILLHYADRIFRNYTIIEKTVVCVTRNADIDTLTDSIEADEDFREHIGRLLKKQKRLAPVRLEIQDGECRRIASYLTKKLSLSSAQVFASAAPLDLGYYGALRAYAPPHLQAQLSFAPFEPATPATYRATGSMMRRLRQGDMLLSHPFETMDPFLALVREAAADSKVVSIQITLYRLAERSRLAESLIAAAENGKDVHIFIELRARMDEENNIGWAKRMEEAGCSVFYGHMDYKMHSKICLITRIGLGGHEFFTHIGTGNYNETTVKMYTDLSLLTADAEIAKDAVLFFRNMMTDVIDGIYPTLWVAPREFKQKLIAHIGREAALGIGGHIVIKCNSLTDRDVIEALVHASMAGARVELIIRGICCLVPGIAGLTDNIHIRSIVGRFLEHSRIYRFGAGEGCDLLIGSGDMMTRNTQRRIELFVPVTDDSIRARLLGMIDVMLHDTVKARALTADGSYIPIVEKSETADGRRLDSQSFFAEEARVASRFTEKTPEEPRGGLRGVSGVLRKIREFFSR
jgi:polyphosphate kinase